MNVPVLTNGLGIELTLVDGKGQLFMDGKDIGSQVRAVKVEVRAGEIVKVEIELIPETIHVKLEGDVELNIFRGVPE